MSTMLGRLRWQLTVFYFLAALLLAVLVGASSYTLLRYYLESSTDLALRYKMASQFHQYGLPLPPELAQAERAWVQANARLIPASTPTRPASHAESDDNNEGESEHPAEVVSTHDETTEEDHLDGRLAPIYILPLDSDGLLQAGSPVPSALIAPDRQASAAALSAGSDLRTTRQADGLRIRLLTYRLDAPGGPTLLQVGRALEDQEGILRQFLAGLLFFGSLSVALLGLGSWWLSGRSLGPAQQAWERQQGFISNASHELRTPLTLIRASAEYLQRDPTPAEASTALADILTESDYMDRLVDDLLLLSRLDTHRLPVERRVVDLPTLLEDVRRQAAKLPAAAQVEVILAASQGQVWADPLRLRQVLLILLDNALGFTPPGGQVRLSARQDGRRCQVYISDSGPGIPPEHLPHVFERFYQVPNPARQEARHNGLGLSIAKALIQAQAGEITLHSQPGRGVQVTLSLPAVP